MPSALHRAASHVGTKYWYVLVHHRHTGRKIPNDRKYSLPFFFLTSKHVARVARAQLGASRHIMHALLFTLLPRPMVLTRMAARAEKSIIRWLPSEILTALMLQMSRLDLVSLCRTSRLLCNIATPLLYRTVCLLKAPQIEYFLRTMAERLNSLPPLSHYVRQFTFFDIKDIIPSVILRGLCASPLKMSPGICFCVFTKPFFNSPTSNISISSSLATIIWNLWRCYYRMGFP
jgi:hypothetical protein